MALGLEAMASVKLSFFLGVEFNIIQKVLLWITKNSKKTDTDVKSRTKKWQKIISLSSFKPHLLRLGKASLEEVAECSSRIRVFFLILSPWSWCGFPSLESPYLPGEAALSFFYWGVSFFGSTNPTPQAFWSAGVTRSQQFFNPKQPNSTWESEANFWMVAFGSTKGNPGLFHRSQGQMWENKNPRCSGSAKGVLPIILAVGYHVDHVPWSKMAWEERWWEIHGILMGPIDQEENMENFPWLRYVSLPVRYRWCEG